MAAYAYGYGYGLTGSGVLDRQSLMIGEIFTDTFERGTLGSSYTSVGAPTVTMTGTDLQLSGGAGTYAKYVRYDDYATDLPYWEMVVNFQAVTSVAAGEGLNIAFKDATGNASSLLILVAHGTGGGNGKTYIQKGTAAPDTYTIMATSATITGGISAGDELRVTITKSDLTITAFTENLTTGNDTTIAYSFGLAFGTTYYMNHVGYPALGTFAGTQLVHDWTFTSDSYKNVRTGFVGDSITHGAGVTTTSQSYPYITMNNAPTSRFTVLAGNGETTAMVLLRIDEILLVKPLFLVLMIGGNDISQSVPQATYEANYANIVTQLEAAGIIVYHALATPRNTVDITPLNTFINANYSASKIVDTYTPLWSGVGTELNAAYDSGDGVHPNVAGATLVGNTIYTAFTNIR